MNMQGFAGLHKSMCSCSLLHNLNQLYKIYKHAVPSLLLLFTDTGSQDLTSADLHLGKAGRVVLWQKINHFWMKLSSSKKSSVAKIMGG